MIRWTFASEAELGDWASADVIFGIGLFDAEKAGEMPGAQDKGSGEGMIVIRAVECSWCILVSYQVEQRGGSAMPAEK